MSDAEKRGMFARKGQERQFTPEEEQLVEEFLRSYAARTIRGEERALPKGVYDAIQAITPQPAIEGIIVDPTMEHYALHRRRQEDEQAFGVGLLHIVGGFEKPDRHGISLPESARRMAKKEMGLDVEYVAGPIAVYQWKRTIEHPTGWPNSQVDVFRAVGNIPQREDTKWFPIGTLPVREEMILGAAGKHHLDFLRVFQKWAKNPNQPCRDLNEHPLTENE